MAASLLQYRLRIRNASTTTYPNGTADVLVISSVPTDSAPYIAAPPSGDGQEVDPLTGSVRTGSYTVEVVDANTGTDATGTIRVLTNTLEDTTFRQQLLSRRAYVELKTDGGAWTTLTAGYILGIRLISPMRYAVAIGDTRRVEQSQTIFQGASLGNYTTRGCLTGGPLTASWGPVKARGGWRYRVAKVGDDVQLTFVDGYEPGLNAPTVTDWRKVDAPAIAEAIQANFGANPYAIGGGSSFVTSYTRPVYDATSGDWIVGGGVQAWVGTSATNAAPVRALVCGFSTTPADQSLGVSHVYLYWPSCPHANGAIVYVSLTTVEVTERTPLYLDAHPVDLVTAIWTNARVNYNASGAWIATMKALIGENVRVAFRFTAPPKIDEFLEASIFGPFGIAARTDIDGRQELFPTRIRTSTAPTLTLGVSAMRGAEEVVFDLDERTAVSSITLRQQLFQAAAYIPGSQTNNSTEKSQGNVPLDGVVVQEVRQTSQYLDPNLTVFTGRAIEYALDGLIHTADNWSPASDAQLQAISVSVFDRFGRGCPSGEVSVLAGTAVAAAQIGDELYVEAPHYPNKNYRIGESSVGARIMQVVRRTETPAGPSFKLLDSGLAAQPATLPTLTIAATSGAPTTTAQFTITNAATLNATGTISVRIEWASGASAPAGGADFATYAPGQIPTAAVPLPALAASGQTVYVRARSEQAGRRPSNWTAWSSVTLSSVPMPTGLTFSNVKQTAATVTWTNTSSTLPLVVFAYQGSSAPATWTAYRLATLPAGSTSTVVRTLTGPSIAWTIGVAYEGAGVLGGIAYATTTTTSTSDTPLRPAALAVIPGVDDATLTQGVALALWPADQTLDLVIERSSTSGSGFTEIARVTGSTPVYVDQRPRDGVTWYYRIAHALGGYALSPYTPEVSAVAAGVPRDVVRPGAVAPVVQVATSETSTTATVTLTITDPQNRVTQVRFRERTGGGSWSAWTIDTSVPYSYSGTIPATGFLDIEYEVSGYNAAGTIGVLAAGVESFDRNSTADMVSVVGTFTSAGALTLALSADSDTASIKFATSTFGQPTTATVQAQSAINARNYATTLAGPYSVGTTVYVSALAYTGLNATGTESVLFEYRFTRGDAAITYLECLATAGSSSATQIVVTVTGTAPSGTSGTPTVQLVSITGSATLASGAAIGTPVASGSSWTFNRGAALGQPGGAQFRAVLSGAQSDDDFIEIPEQGRDTTYLTTRARVLTTTATQVTVRYAVLDKYSALTSTVSYVATGTGTVTPGSGGTVTAAVGDTFTSPEVAGSYIDYTIDRPAFQAGTGRVTFTASATGRVADSDAVDIPAQERDTTYLSCRARVTATTATQVTVRLAVLDKYTALTSTIAYATQGTGTVTPGSGGTVSAAVGDTYASPETAGSYVDYTIDRPAFGAGTGRITFTVTASGRVAATDAVDIPAIERDTIALTSRARIFSQTATQMVVRYAVASPVALSPNTASMAYVAEGLSAITPISPQTITPETNTQITETAGSYVDWTVPRPAVGATPGRITFQATATGRTATTDAVDIPPQDRVGPSLKVVTTPGASSYTLVITWDGTIAYALDGVSQSVSGWVSPLSLTLTRNAYLGETQVVALAVTKDSVTVSESINIPAKDTSGATLTIGTQTADDATDQYTFSWSTSGMPSGTTYDLTYTTTTTAGVIERGTLNSQISPVTVVSGYNIGTTPTYQMTINAIKDGTLILTKSRTGTFLT